MQLRVYSGQDARFTLFVLPDLCLRTHCETALTRQKACDLYQSCPRLALANCCLLGLLGLGTLAL